MRTYIAKIELDCEVQIIAESAKRAHFMANYYVDVVTGTMDNKEEYMESLDSNITEVELEIEGDDETEKIEWLICDNCNGEGIKCLSCEGTGEVRA